MNETVIKILQDKIEAKQNSLAYHQQEAKDYRALVRAENAQVKQLKQEIADMQEVLNDAAD
jgi:peptidoglycan hydrolase CwlO-like protein